MPNINKPINRIDMQNYGIKIDLQKLKNAFLWNLKGKTATKKCICIPVDDNPAIYVGEKGVYLNLTAVETENQQYNDTHYVKGNIPREIYDKMSDDVKKSFPILGNMRPIVAKQQEASGTVDMNDAAAQNDDDLPF